MSLINRVLKELDQKGQVDAPLPTGVRPVVRTADHSGRRRLRVALMGGALCVTLLAGWWYRPTSVSEAQAPDVSPPAVPTAAIAPEAQSAQAHDADAAEALAMPALRLSEVLSVGRPPVMAPARVAGAVASRPAPAAPPAETMPRLDEGRTGAEAEHAAIDIRAAVAAQGAEALWRQGQAMLQRGDAQQAVELWQRALQSDPLHLEARQALTLRALDEGRLDDARRLLEEGMQLHPGVAWFMRGLTKLHLQQREYAQAAELLGRALDRRAEAEDWSLYASVLARLNRFEESAAAYRQALRREPRQGAWWLGLAHALELSGRPEEAHSAYARASQTDLRPELLEFARRKAQE